MFRAAIASLVLICSLGSPALARPIVNQLNTAATAATPSQVRSSGLSYLSADDFVMSSASAVTDISTIEIIMIGRGTAGLLPSQSKFGVQIYTNSSLGGDHPSSAVITRLGCNSVQDLGVTPSGMRRYKATFVFPTGTARVLSNRRYWIVGFGRLDDANSWCFARSPSAAATGRPTFQKASTGGSWFAAPASWGDRSFRIVGY